MPRQSATQVSSIAIALAGLLVSGCTTRLATAVDPGVGLTKGLPYALPAAEAEAKVTIRLVRCGMVSNGKADLGWEVVATSAINLVEGERRLIDYEKLLDGPKTGSIDVEFHEIADPADKDKKITTRFIKSINADVEDKSPELIKEAIALGGTVVRIASGVAPLAGGATQTIGGGVEKPACSPTVAALVKQRKSLGDALETLEKQAKADKVTVEKLLEAASKKALDAEGRAEVRKLTIAAAKRQEQIGDVTEQLAKFDKVNNTTLALSVSTSIAATSDPLNSFDKADDSAIAAWNKTILHDDLKNSAGTVAKTMFSTPGEFKVSIAMVRSGSVAPETNVAKQSSNDFYVREPVKGDLVVCRSKIEGQSAEPGQGRCSAGMVEQGSTTGKIPQLGAVRSFPLVNGFGEHAKLAIILTQDGEVQQFSYGKLKAGGPAALSSVNDLLTTIDGVDTAVQEKKEKEAKDKADKLAAKKGEPLALLKANNSLLDESEKNLKYQVGVHAAASALQASKNANSANADLAGLLQAVAIIDSGKD